MMMVTNFIEHIELKLIDKNQLEISVLVVFLKFTIELDTKR